MDENWTKHQIPSILPATPEPTSEQEYRKRLAEFVGDIETNRIMNMQSINKN